MVEDNETTNQRRPAGVWIIFVLIILSALLAFYSILYVAFKKPDIFAQLSKAQLFVSYSLIILNLVGVIYLFRLKVVALWIFVTTISIGLLSSLGFMLAGYDIPELDFEAPNTRWLKLIIWVVIIAYVSNLKKKGVLR